MPSVRVPRTLAAVLTAVLIAISLSAASSRVAASAPDAGVHLIDPAAFLEQTLIPGDLQGLDQLGFSVAVSGDTAIVGARHHTWTAGLRAGAAYVFARSGSAWALQAKLTASDASQEDAFGFSVAIDGDTAVVGAQGTEAAYVFVRSNGAWVEEARLDGPAASSFGYSVAIGGNVVAVGAPGTASAHVFVRQTGAWTGQGTLQGTGATTPQDEFGRAVAVAGDSVLVGAPFDDTTVGTNSGSVFVFTRTGDTWPEADALTPADASGDFFGYAVAVDGDRAVIGALQGDAFTVFNMGAAYVYERTAGAWQQRAKLTASDAAENDRFGGSVSISGDRILVGASGVDTTAYQSVGAAYLFELNAGGIWDEQTKLMASAVEADSDFGHAVGLSGDMMLVGAYRQNDANGITSGRAYSYVEQTAADLLVGVGQDRLNVKQGEELTYVITVANSGGNRALNTVVRDTLPSGAVFSSASEGRGLVHAPAFGQTGTVTWSLGEVLAGGEETAQLVVKIIVRGKTTISNTVTVTSDTPDPNAANNTASITTTVASGGSPRK